MKLTVEQVRHVAQLARMTLTPDEEQRYQSQLSAILDAVDQLKALETSDVEPTSHATLAEGLVREDQVRPSMPTEVGLANAPAKLGTSFAVPKILE
jgi:aspartyl-tRNA(Asn)/glutamyl-tRNA(Gln) amidotransferase subunit C